MSLLDVCYRSRIPLYILGRNLTMLHLVKLLPPLEDHPIKNERCPVAATISVLHRHSLEAADEAIGTVLDLYIYHKNLWSRLSRRLILEHRLPRGINLFVVDSMRSLLSIIYSGLLSLAREVRIISLIFIRAC